jgi:putative DNA methylase
MTGQGHRRRKLIEVSIPLEEINAESAREKSIRHGHPSTLHLWWARRPLAAARAVLFAQLVDDPIDDPAFPDEESQKAERERLHALIRRLVKWENIGDERLYAEAHAEIMRSTGGNPPAILDPFAGGGTIPLEAQRLGLEAHASDLNPVAVLINKALIEIPPKFAGQAPVSPDAEQRISGWPRATGLAEDVRRYGAWMRARAAERIGHLYPQAQIPVTDTAGKQTGRHTEANVIAWIWARTATCPNPACGVQMPLVRTWWLGKKKGREAYIIPTVVDDATAPSGKSITFTIGHDPAKGPTNDKDGTMSGQRGGTCVACQSFVSAAQVHSQTDVDFRNKPQSVLMAVVAEGRRQRVYLEPTIEQLAAVSASTTAGYGIRTSDGPLGAGARGTFGGNAQGRRWGFFTFADYFTNRQLVALTTLGDLVPEAREQILKDALNAGMTLGPSQANAGMDAQAYADAVATYLGLAVDRIGDRNSSVTTWDNSTSKEQVRGVFARQAIPMAWDFAVSNPFSSSSGTIGDSFRILARTLENLPARNDGYAQQADASARSYADVVISTDPPYYDNIGYSDLSDFFYVWLRRSLRPILPSMFTTMLVPKTEELVANPYRHGSKAAAEKFFEAGFEHVFGRARDTANPHYPITVFYAFKQAELEKEGVASTGWSTFLEGMIRQGWSITATWPIRSEMSNRMIASGTNALASSIVLALRPREASAPATDRSGFLTALRAELDEALPKIREGAIAPADLRQTILGPGMAVYSRYSRVLESDGAPMPVKTALALINRAFDAFESEQDGDLDADTRFCLDWLASYAWSTRPYGDAESLAVPLGISVEGVARGGVITSRGNKVALVKPQELDSAWNPSRDDRISLWEATCQLARAYAADGRAGAAQLMASITDHPSAHISLEDIQRLALRLYELLETKDAPTAGLFNGLGGAWADIVAASRTIQSAPVQGDFDFDTVRDTEGDH